jgi:hypothetical protein
MALRELGLTVSVRVSPHTQESFHSLYILFEGFPGFRYP